MPPATAGPAGAPNHRFEEFARLVPGALLSCRTDSQGRERLEHLNTDGHRLWGLDPAVPPPDMATLWSMVDAGELPTLRQALGDSIARCTDGQHRWHITTRSGLRRWVQGHWRALREPDGSTVLHMLMFELALPPEKEPGRQQSEERFRRLIDAIPDVAVQGYDRHLVCRFWNSASERLYGFSEAEALGRSLLDLIIPVEMREEVITATRRMLESGEAIPSAELCLRHKDGSAVNVHSGHVLLHHEAGHPEFFCIDFDLSERQRAEDARQLLQSQLREAQKMEALGTLAGGIAHDFNNILAAILGNAALALEECAEGSPASTSLREIQKAARRARAVVQQILTFARRQEARHQALDLPPLVEEVHSLLRTTAPAGVSIAVDIEPGLPRIVADANQFGQVILNLGTNAVQAVRGHHQARVLIALSHCRQPPPAGADGWQVLQSGAPQEQGGVLLRVSDNGMGMAPENMRRIFEPFFTTKARGEGTGLGLAVVHGILKEHDAGLTVSSRPDEGTAFEIWLPAQQALAGPSPPPEQPPAAPRASQRPCRVLYVDDDALLTDLVNRQLGRAGHRVTALSSPQAALDRLGSGEAAFDVLVVDHNMPEMSGLALAAAARRLLPDLPVILTSAVVAEDLHESARRLGIHRVIEKSESVHQLFELLDRLGPGP
ncbi:MAG TPA: ATP-binding protein [Hydrogenophaga sp.]|uniref:hybrid sensor histidine kinase/response regulator n=1 Tax=Hydrogenophaga sp. TaxID=1904254 RepID=UPI002B6D6E72|nr:ATP-binding protein [Hydrogenophaga sp.]HMN92112.1 ATP-binding protein [Hydrogenophaga sp.]HMP10520.1 ATP-binding protein [Hydrogenophaga sp.]